MVAEIAEGGGDFLVATQTQEVDRGVAKGGQILWGMLGFHAAVVLAKRHVANPMQTIFDAPVPTPMLHQKCRVSLFA